MKTLPTLPKCGRPGSVRIEAYAPANGQLHGSLDAAYNACPDHVQIVMQLITDAGYTPYRAGGALWAKMCGEGIDYTQSGLPAIMPAESPDAEPSSAEVFAAEKARLLADMERAGVALVREAWERTDMTDRHREAKFRAAAQVRRYALMFERDLVPSFPHAMMMLRVAGFGGTAMGSNIEADRVTSVADSLVEQGWLVLNPDRVKSYSLSDYRPAVYDDRVVTVEVGDLGFTVDLDEPADVLGLIMYSIENYGSPRVIEETRSPVATWELGDDPEDLTLVSELLTPTGDEPPRYRIHSLTQAGWHVQNPDGSVQPVEGV